MIVYTCKDTFEDMMTCIYDAWASKEGHKNIRLQTEPLGNLELFCEYRHIDADPNKYIKVIRSIQQKLSYQAYQMVFRCAMSAADQKLDMIYRFLLLGFSYPKQVLHMLQHPYVMNIFEQNRKVMNETHLFREFTRFKSTSEGILVAFIEPKSNILTLLAPAFDDRIPSENWMIIDANRHLTAVHEADQETYFTAISETEQEQILEAADDHDFYITLWKDFFRHIAIKQRTNPICQRTHMPIWYRKHAIEFNET